MSEPWIRKAASTLEVLSKTFFISAARESLLRKRLLILKLRRLWGELKSWPSDARGLSSSVLGNCSHQFFVELTPRVSLILAPSLSQLLNIPCYSDLSCPILFVQRLVNLLMAPASMAA